MKRFLAIATCLAVVVIALGVSGDAQQPPQRPQGQTDQPAATPQPWQGRDGFGESFPWFYFFTFKLIVMRWFDSESAGKSGSGFVSP